MINGVGSASPTRIGQVKDDKVNAPAAVGSVASTSSGASAPSLVDALAEAGPPVNDAKIQAIRDAIATGQYPIDANAIARKMIELDLPKANA